MGELKAAFHATSTAETPIGSYANEYAFFLTFTSDGTKLVKVDEMVNSDYAKSFFRRLGRYMKQGGKL